eukprot:CAMPEP_0198251610 /NCGR_PEP_ID=MMETSP1447-20131203/2393_1 /TAXON_ID=420782 /ORGANISM="Chaetoceros dichaeta, Strain CCMP1751" /LENGTH=501 /DNA_ID=CAMNT_0043936683 /DNA_START=52 /DNA_END=1557 /DNA_ORIENTATION=+
MGETFESNSSPRQSPPQQSRSPGRGLLLGMKKPVLLLVVLVSIGIGLYALFGWLKLPNLNGQVKELKTQVDLLNREINQLATQVDILQSENDRFGSSNDQLNRTIDQFDEITGDLNSTAKQLEDLSGELSVTNLELMMEVDRLELVTSNLSSIEIDLRKDSTELQIVNDELNRNVDQVQEIGGDLNLTINDLRENSNQLTEMNTALNDRVAVFTELNANLTIADAMFTQLNANLTTTTDQLTQEVVRINALLDDLNQNRTELENVTSRLKNENADLEIIINGQNQKLIRLGGIVDNFTAQNTLLQMNNENIMSATGILNSSLFDSSLAFATATRTLARQIDASYALELAEDVQDVLELKEVNVRKIEVWDCDYRDFFRDEGADWAGDFTLPIVGQFDFDDVISYIGKIPFFEGLCLKTTNFVEFLGTKYPDVELTSNLTSDQLLKGVDEYALLALVHYFPDASECGINTEAWTAAGYSCNGLADEETFLWSTGEVNKFCVE